jgi:2-phospho-L-lactate transferase/gluconeogenesis factor (CofD/UPF0052 family)
LQDSDQKKAFLAGHAAPVKLSPQCRNAISKGDLIVIGPGTLDSSIIPTTMSQGFWEALWNARGARVFIANLVRERGNSTVSEQLARLEVIMQRELGREFLLHDVLDYVIVNDHGFTNQSVNDRPHVPADLEAIHVLGLEIIRSRIEDHSACGVHDGSRVCEILLGLV